MPKLQFLKQKNMLRVLYALAPVALVSVYFYGWRVVGILAVCTIAGFLTEWIMVSKRNGKVTYACFVTTGILALSLTPTVPLWIAAVSSVVAILFAKEAFGGFGKNVFNPALVGRGFAFVSFPVEITGRYVPVFKDFPGGFIHWSIQTAGLPEYLAKPGLKVADAITAATPMWAQRDYGFVTSIKDLFLGTIGTTFEYEGSVRILAAGANAEVCSLVLILAGAYLLITKTANWRLPLSTLLGAAAMNLFLRHGLGIEAVPVLPFTLFSGALMYASVFMVTDPVSAPKVKESQWLYGLFIGSMVVFFRYKAIFTEGVTFALLMGNMLSPSLDLWIKRWKGRGKKSRQ